MRTQVIYTHNFGINAINLAVPCTKSSSGDMQKDKVQINMGSQFVQSGILLQHYPRHYVIMALDSLARESLNGQLIRLWMCSIALDKMGIHIPYSI